MSSGPPLKRLRQATVDSTFKSQPAMSGTAIWTEHSCWQGTTHWRVLYVCCLRTKWLNLTTRVFSCKGRSANVSRESWVTLTINQMNCLGYLSCECLPRYTLCVSAVFAVSRCPSVCLSVSPLRSQNFNGRVGLVQWSRHTVPESGSSVLEDPRH